jgi:ABC-2 type transport system ATP-binding protein
VRELVDTFRAYYPDPLPRSVIIETAGLEDYVDAKVSALSGGYRQRLYFALAIAGNPTVLFLDEPTSRMDTATRIGFLQRIREFADSGRTVILTTHYLDEADALADRVIVVDQGSVIADASPSAIKGRLGGKRVRFETRLGIELHELSSLPYHTVSFDGALATFITDDPEDLLRGLFERGIPVSSLEVSGADLEEAFLALTNQRPDRGQAFRVEIARGAA